MSILLKGFAEAVTEAGDLLDLLFDTERHCQDKLGQAAKALTSLPELNYSQM
jgi:hypothetical protein